MVTQNQPIQLATPSEERQVEIIIGKRITLNSTFYQVNHIYVYTKTIVSTHFVPGTQVVWLGDLLQKVHGNLLLLCLLHQCQVMRLELHKRFIGKLLQAEVTPSTHL